jgi:mediator of RNA polymerase II transcription subunit 14
MAKDKEWNDVRLLSFDLQTVEFAYSGDYTLSITCTDQISATGSFNLRFSRVSQDDGIGSTDDGSKTRTEEPANASVSSEREKHALGGNPHDEAEPFLRSILRHGHGRLAPSLSRLVGILRETLPVVTELEEIRRECGGVGVDVFAKAAGWYRMLYGDLR